jgi:hypothetical protein
LTGCAIGCGCFVLLVGMLIAGTCVFVRGIVGEVAEVEESRSALVERYGEPDDFRPTADGSIAPERIVCFLEVRRSLEAERGELHGVFERFPPEDDQGKLRTLFKVLGGLAGMIDDIVGYIDARNRALLEHEMGYGEYLYIYSVGYYSWLGHDPADGPTVDGERLFDGHDSTFGADECRAGYRSFMSDVLRNQLDGLSGDADPVWRERLREEIEAMERDRRHVAWRGDLPAPIESSLEPYREAFVEAYDPTTNCFELPTGEQNRRGAFRWTIE